MTVPAGDYHALEALARYCGRNPVGLDRLRFTPGLSTLTYRPRGGHDEEPVDTVDALDFVARVLAHIPDPRRHLVHYYGAYSNVARGKAKASGHAAKAQPLVPGPGGVDPLVCPRCRGVMRVVSFITQPRLIRRILDHLAGRATQERAPPAAPGAVLVIP